MGSRFIKVTALVSDSSLFDSSRDILLGEDVLRRRIGTVIPCDREVIWWAREDEPYEVLDLLERTYGIAGRRNVDIFHRGGVANLSEDPMKNSSKVTDSYPSSSGSLTVDPVGVVETARSPSGNYLTNYLAVSRGSEENVLLNDVSNRGDRAPPAGDAERELNGSRDSYNPNKRTRANRKLYHSK